ncbi:MAG TPA: ATP-binding protein [Jatrophihabitantaceae bacterium]
MTPGIAGDRTRPVVLGAAIAAAAAAATVLALRIDVGLEPEGRNWWLTVEVALGLCYLPVGAAILTRRRLALGLVFVLVGASQLGAAILSEWHALNGPASTLGGGRAVEITGLLLLAAVVPFLLPWPRENIADDRLTRWLALGVLAAGVGATAAVFDGVGDLAGAHVAAPLLLLSTVPLLAVGAFVAEIRDDPVARATVSHRFLVWAILASAIALVYTALVAGFGSVLGSDGPAWLLVGVTGGLAVALEPARSRLRHFVDDLVYGKRGDPLAVVRQLVAQQVATATDVDERLLGSLADTIAEALRLDHVAIDLLTPGGWSRVAEHGESVDGDEDLSLSTGDQVLGRLVVGCRGSALGGRDRDVLADVVPHVTLAVGLVRLTSDLRRSRLAVVTAQEEERRRLRRDLHDGIGPTLTGVSMALHTVVRRMRRGSSDAYDVTLLAQLADEVDRTVGDVKRIVRDLLPTALDDQGLAAALAEFARNFEGVIDIDLDLPTAEPGLPAAVEIAIYRIATEAMTNVVRHASARSCCLCLAVAERVELDVRDDGIGIASVHPPGVGLATMRERAVQLGGTLAITSVEPHGTRVHASLPVAVG